MTTSPAPEVVFFIWGKIWGKISPQWADFQKTLSAKSP